jgi:uncharacterized membrane protein YgcG
MNRVAVLLFAAVLVIAVYAIVAFAQPGMMGGGGAMVGSSEEMGLDPLEENMGMRGARMGPPWMNRGAIAVSGNNVFVISGDLLLKYDQNLNLVAQAELPAAEMGPGRGTGRGGGGRGGGGRGGGGRGGGGRGMRGGGPR